MEKHTREKLKSFLGTGKVFSGEKLLGEGTYHIDVYQEFIEGQAPTGTYRVPGLKVIVGTMRGPFPIGVILKLVTTDGDTLPFFIAESNTGRLEASGPFLTKEGKFVV